MTDTNTIPELELPESITVLRSFTFNTAEIVQDFINEGNYPSSVSEKYIMDMILERVREQMSEYVDRHDLVICDSETGSPI